MSTSVTAASPLDGDPTDGDALSGDTDDAESTDTRRPLAELFRDLRTSPAGLAGREAARRLRVYSPNELARGTGRRWPGELRDQFTQPLVILLAVAAVLAWVGGTPALSAAVVAVILVFSGTTCTGGEASAVVTRTGMHTELGRIAALSRRGRTEPSPLERQVRRVTWIIAAVAVVIGVAFVPVGLAAGLGWAAAITFSIGLIVANVPEGLLPTITLALAAGVRQLARSGAVVKRLSAVETLGSVTVICTDKTGTLAENRMRVTRLWFPGPSGPSGDEFDATTSDPRARLLAATAAACTTAEAPPGAPAIGDPTELALLRLAADQGVAVGSAQRGSDRQAVFHFDAHLQRMSTADIDTVNIDTVGHSVVHTKGAPEAVLALCTRLVERDGADRPLDAADRTELRRTLDRFAASGLRVLAVFELVFTGAVIYAPPLQEVFGTAALYVLAARDPRPVPGDRLGRRRARPLDPSPS